MGRVGWFIFWPSISLMMLISAAVPVKKASSASNNSSSVMVLSWISIFSSRAISRMLSLVIPGRMNSSDGVMRMPFLMMKMFSPGPSAMFPF